MKKSQRAAEKRGGSVPQGAILAGVLGRPGWGYQSVSGLSKEHRAHCAGILWAKCGSRGEEVK